MVTENKQKSLKLGNWQVYLLDKLYQLYIKGIFCDVTLKFNNNMSIQAHKVVLKACTTFFDHLPTSSSGVILHMPQSMNAHFVKPIINFMYSGKLEYMSEDQNHIYLAAKQLGMNVLTELLQVQVTPSPATKKPQIPVKNYVPKSTPNNQRITNTEASPSPVVEVEGTPIAGLPGKRLPFWKKRSTLTLPQEFYNSTNKKCASPSVEQLPIPTRFEWPDNERLPEVVLTQSSVDDINPLSYHSEVIAKPVYDPKPVILQDSIEMMPISTPVIQHGTKRVRDSEVVREHGEDEDDDSHYSSIHDAEDYFEDDLGTHSNSIYRSNFTTPPKPILKHHEVSTPSPSKKVRFSFSSDKPNNVDNESQRGDSPVAVPVTSPSNTTTQTVTVGAGPAPLNHTKIINEILRKYPELVKNNRNIKLKIQSGTNSQITAPNSVDVDKDSKTHRKIQYVVLKSDFAPARKEAKTETIGAENTSGPWFCTPCGGNNGPTNFDSYFMYRKHLQEVHNEKIDARICEYCGYKAAKRNLHLYHLYTKHDIPPPRNINFPKCDQCDYIALTEILLIKHKSNHTGVMNKEFVCRLCNATFKSYGALMGHMQTNLHYTDQAAKKDYECEFCGKIFNRNINLKAHIRTSHQDESRKAYDDEDRTEEAPEEPLEEPQSEPSTQNLMEVIEVPVFGSVSEANNKALYLPQGMTILAESPSVPLMPSSESEAMNNVATGIATSINITDRNVSNDVIVIDGNAEIILRGAPAYVLNPDGSYSVQEYIVPDMINDSGQVYTALVSTAPATGISYVSSDNISIVTSPDHTYADGMKINGHVTTTPQGQTVITSQAQVSQANQPIIMQEPIIVSADWVQSIATSTSQPQGQKVDIISVDTAAQTSQMEDSTAVEKTAQNLVSDWGEIEDETQEESQETADDDESDVKPSRPTIELDTTNEIDM